MAEQYDFFKPYEGMDFDLTPLKNAATLRRDRYDANQQKYYDQKNLLDSIRVGPGDEYLKYNAQQDIEDMFQGNLSFESLDDTIFQMSNRIAGDTNLAGALENAAIYKKMKADKATSRANQKPVIDYNEKIARDPITNEIITKTLPDGRIVPETEHLFDTWSYEHQGTIVPNVVPIMDYGAKMQALMANIESNPVLLQKVRQLPGLSGATLADIKMYLMEGDAVSDEKVALVAGAIKDVYLNTPEGMQHMDLLTERTLFPGTNELYTTDMAEAEIERLLAQSAAPQIGEKLNYISNTKRVIDAKKDPPPPPSAPPLERDWGFVPSDIQLAVGDKFEFLDDMFDTKGASTNIYKIEHPTAGKVGAWTETKNITDADKIRIDKLLKDAGGIGNLSKGEISRNKSLITSWMLTQPTRTAPAFAGMTDREYAEAYWQALRSSPGDLTYAFNTAQEELMLNKVGKEVFAGPVTYKGKRYDLGKPNEVDALAHAIDEERTTPFHGEGDIKTEIMAMLTSGKYNDGTNDFIPNYTFNKAGKDAGAFRIDLPIPKEGNHTLYAAPYVQQTKGFAVVQSIYKQLLSKDLQASGGTELTGPDAAEFLNILVGIDPAKAPKSYWVRNKMMRACDACEYQIVPALTDEDGKVISISDGAGNTRRLEGMFWVDFLSKSATYNMVNANRGTILGVLFDEQKPVRSTIFN
jgi:hypothetical protein